MFTPRLRESTRFGEAFAHATQSLAAHGAVGAIERLLED